MSFSIGKIWDSVKNAVAGRVDEIKTHAKEFNDAGMGTRVAKSLQDGKIDENELQEIAKAPLDRVKVLGGIAKDSTEHSVAGTIVNIFKNLFSKK